MQKVKLHVLASLLIAFSSFVSANNQLVLNYDGFFDRMDDLRESQYQDIKLAFYFMDTEGKACPIKSVRLQTQLKQLDVYHLETGEILLPFDHQLDADKAAIVIEKQDDKTCGLNMRLESVVLLDEKVEISKAQSLINTFDLALDDLAGMMSFTLPDVVGITFKGPENQTLAINNRLAGKCKLNSCTLTKQELQQYLSQGQTTLTFSHSIAKALPYIQQ